MTRIPRPAALWSPVLATVALGCSEAPRPAPGPTVDRPESALTTVPPAPVTSPPVPFRYDATGLRDPFDSPVSGWAGAADGDFAPVPDLDRARTTLETFAMAELRMIGILAGRGLRSALVRDPGGHVHRVNAGDYLGRDYGRVEAIGDAGLEVLESIADGSGGWVTRVRAIRLTRPTPVAEPAVPESPGDV